MLRIPTDPPYYMSIHPNTPEQKADVAQLFDDLRALAIKYDVNIKLETNVNRTVKRRTKA